MANGRTRSKPAICLIRLKGELDEEMAAYWFEGFSVECEPGGITKLTGYVADEAALYGLLARIRDLGIPLLSLEYHANN